MAARQDLLLALIRRYESASKEQRLEMTALVVSKCQDSTAPVPTRLKRIYADFERDPAHAC